jgi:hypothetical protein
MNVIEAAKFVGSRFKYTSDPKSIFDPWFVMRERNGIMRGDCDDFTLTVIWYVCDQNIWKFIWNVMILHKYQMHRVRATGYHLVGTAEGLWFDNFTREAMPRDEFFARTKHRHLYIYPSFVMIFPLIAGYFFNQEKRD